MPKLQIPKKLLPIVQKKKRYKILIGGRNSAKSTTVGDVCLMDSQAHSLKIGCFREFQNSIEDSVYSLLQDEVDRLGLQGFVFQNNKVFNNSGGSFRFRGLARNIDSAKSMQGFERFWIEEGQFLSDASIKIITKTIRESDSEIWITANPMSKADPFSQRFIVPFLKQLERDGYYEDDMHLIIVCNYKDNPWHNDTMEQERLYDKEHMSPAEYEHVWLGKFNDTVENAIISSEWFDAAVDAHKKLGFQPSGIDIVSHDPSDIGPDPKGLVHRQGSVIKNILEKDTGTIHEGALWALEYAVEVNAGLFIWDGDGMGVGIRQTVSDYLTGSNTVAHMFRGSEGVERPAEMYAQVKSGKLKIEGKTNKDTFKNKRSQFSWYLRDRFYKTYLAVEHKQYSDPDDLISIDSSIKLLDQFRSETCRIPRKRNESGKIQIMSKEEMCKPPLNLPSPNLFDSAMMSLDIPDVDQAETINIDFDSWYGR